MEDREIVEYKHKIKGLSPKELNDIFSHINREKFPGKCAAIQEEMALRGLSSEAPVATLVHAPVHQEPTELVAASQQADAVPATRVAAPAILSPGSKISLDGLLMFLAVLFFTMGAYFLLLPFFPLPGAESLRALLG